MYRFICSPKVRLAIAYLLLALLAVSCKKDIVNNKVQNQEIVSASSSLMGDYWTWIREDHQVGA